MNKQSKPTKVYQCKKCSTRVELDEYDHVVCTAGYAKDVFSINSAKHKRYYLCVNCYVHFLTNNVPVMELVE